MDFAREDAAADLLFNEVLWRSVRGSKSPMPAPVHAAFVFPRPPQTDPDYPPHPLSMPFPCYLYVIYM